MQVGKHIESLPREQRQNAARINELAVKLVSALKYTENRAANLSDQLDEAASRRRIRELAQMKSQIRVKWSCFL